MTDDGGDGELARLAAEIHRFVQAHPHHYAVVALVDVMAQESAGKRVDPDERMLALTSVVQALRRR
jgi:hypothetical protein